MNLQDIEGFCAANNLEFKEVGGEDELGAGLLFHWTPPNNPQDPECVHMTFKALEDVTSQELLKIVINGRDVLHMTRVVGYYSRTQNWNKSKLGELKDRHKGRYAVQASEAAKE
jgi:hypothetical protein